MPPPAELPLPADGDLCCDEEAPPFPGRGELEGALPPRRGLPPRPRKFRCTGGPEAGATDDAPRLTVLVGSIASPLGRPMTAAGDGPAPAVSRGLRLLAATDGPRTVPPSEAAHVDAALLRTELGASEVADDVEHVGHGGPTTCPVGGAPCAAPTVGKPEGLVQPADAQTPIAAVADRYDAMRPRMTLTSGKCHHSAAAGKSFTDAPSSASPA